MLGYEKFGAYKKALEFFAYALALQEKGGESKGGIADQLRRAALSVVLNSAEGSGKEGREFVAASTGLPEPLPWNVGQYLIFGVS